MDILAVISFKFPNQIPHFAWQIFSTALNLSLAE